MKAVTVVINNEISRTVTQWCGQRRVYWGNSVCYAFSGSAACQKIQIGAQL